MSRLRVLFVAMQCNPELVSVPLVAWKMFEALGKKADVTLVTHERHAAGFERVEYPGAVDFVEPGPLFTRFYHWMQRSFNKDESNWALINALNFPMYASFNSQVYKRYLPRIEAGEFDVVHAFSPVIPRYPVKLGYHQDHIPFVLGPVNGGLRYPEGFEEYGKQENSWLHPLRELCHIIPGYRRTYQKADKILVGSSDTLRMLDRSFDLHPEQLELCPENGIDASFLMDPKEPEEKVKLLFVGRLVPVKGCDMVIEALARLPEASLDRVQFDIVGDGAERQRLAELAHRLGLSSHVQLHGRVDHERTRDFYRDADLFCFPSVREFGGAVAIEAMAAGLPCLVLDYGGPADTVSAEAGVKIPATHRADVIQVLGQAIHELVQNSERRSRMAHAARAEAEKYLWSHKATNWIKMYRELIKAHAVHR